MNKIWMLGLSLVIALFSCTDPDLIGLEIQPLSDRITINTLENDGAFLSLSSTVEDSVKSDENNLNLLGAYTDPIFGDVEAHFSTQLLLSESAVDFGDKSRSLISCSTLNVRWILWNSHSANAFRSSCFR